MKKIGRSQNTVPLASTQTAIKGTVQYSMGHTLTRTQAHSQLVARLRGDSDAPSRVAHRFGSDKLYICHGFVSAGDARGGNIR